MWRAWKEWGGWEGEMLAMLIALGTTPGTDGGNYAGSKLPSGHLASRMSSEQSIGLGQ